MMLKVVKWWPRHTTVFKYSVAFRIRDLFHFNSNAQDLIESTGTATAYTLVWHSACRGSRLHGYIQLRRPRVMFLHTLSVWIFLFSCTRDLCWKHDGKLPAWCLQNNLISHETEVKKKTGTTLTQLNVLKGSRKNVLNKRVQMKPEKHSYPSKLESKNMSRDRSRVLIEQMRMNSIMDLISYSSTTVTKKQHAIITKAFDLLICRGSFSNDLFLPIHTNVTYHTRQSLTIGCNQFPLLPLCHSKAVKKNRVLSEWPHLVNSRGQQQEVDVTIDRLRVISVQLQALKTSVSKSTINRPFTATLLTLINEQM